MGAERTSWCKVGESELILEHHARLAEHGSLIRGDFSINDDDPQGFRDKYQQVFWLLLVYCHEIMVWSCREMMALKFDANYGDGPAPIPKLTERHHV